MVRELVDDGEFIEVFVDAPLEVCIQRDPKGLYKKARAGEINDFTGIHAPFEEPIAPQLVLPTHELTVEQCVGRLITMLEKAGIFNPPK